MATRTVTKITNAGIAGTMHSVDTEDIYPWPDANPATILLEVETGATADTVTVVSQAAASDGLAAEDKTVTLASNARSLIRIGQAFRDDDGNVTVQHSVTSNVDAGGFY